MERLVPSGYREDPNLTREVHAVYRALTGQECKAEVYLSERMGARTAGMYRRLGTRHLIVLSRRYHDLAPRDAFQEIVLHELAHYHLVVSGHPDAGHGLLFRQLMRLWGFRRFPDPEVLGRIAQARPKLRHLYLCPKGHAHWLSRHPHRRPASCALCSPRFDRRFLLRYSGRSEAQ